MKFKSISTLIFTLISGSAFSAEYMMCYSESARMAQVKNSIIRCEGTQSKNVTSSSNLTDLHAQNWRVSQMTITQESEFYRVNLLMIKE